MKGQFTNSKLNILIPLLHLLVGPSSSSPLIRDSLKIRFKFPWISMDFFRLWDSELGVNHQTLKGGRPADIIDLAEPPQFKCPGLHSCMKIQHICCLYMDPAVLSSRWSHIKMPVHIMSICSHHTHTRNNAVHCDGAAKVTERLRRLKSRRNSRGIWNKRQGALRRGRRQASRFI